MAEGGSFQLLSTPRFDPQLTTVREKGLKHAGWNYTNDSPFYLLGYHRDRLLKGAVHFGWSAAVEELRGPANLERLSQRLLEFVGENQATPLRLRILVGQDGKVEFGKFEFASCSLKQLFPRRLPPPGSEPAQDEPAKSPAYELLVDSERTAQTEHTYFKTTERPMYDASRKRAAIEPGALKEALVVSQSGFVTEGSITTPYFWRDGRWLTPSVPATYNPSDEIGGQDGVSRRWAIER